MQTVACGVFCLPCTARHWGSADRAGCAGSALFFEVRHYKAQEKKFSTLGWSFLPVEVLVDPSSSPAGFGATSRQVDSSALPAGCRAGMRGSLSAQAWEGFAGAGRVQASASVAQICTHLCSGVLQPF